MLKKYLAGALACTAAIAMSTTAFADTTITLMASQDWVKDAEMELGKKFEEETGIHVDYQIVPADQYQDMMGKHNSLPAIRKRIADCHQHGMVAMAYGAVYAACRSFREAHPTWGLYGTSGAR